MEGSNQKKKGWEIVVKYTIFLLLVTLIVILFPKTKQFKYTYDLGKPWRHELLVASFDFPIYKSDAQIDDDKKELLGTVSPYFKVDKDKSDQLFNKWLDEWRLHNQNDPIYANYIKERFSVVYLIGILSSSVYEDLKNENQDKIILVYDNGRTEEVSLEDIYTPKSAYEYIIKKKPASIKQTELDSYNIDKYLLDNIYYDEVTTQKVKNDVLKTLSTTSGMIQKGEKIIDKGDIVTHELFAILDSMKIESNNRSSFLNETIYAVVGEVIIVFGLILFLALYLKLFRPNLYNQNKLLLFIALQIAVIIAMSALLIRLTNISVYVVPFAMLAIIIRVFFDSRTALFTHMITVLIVSFMVIEPFKFVVLQLVVGMAAVSGLKDLTSRSQLFKTAVIVFLSYSITYIAFHLITTGHLAKFDYFSFVYFAISSIVLLFAYITIYFLEKMFKLISAVTLVELTNVNSDLMIKFSESAPGSFQHSLQVSNLATEAAKEIGANALLVRTGALYHDIGKMIDPQNFIENQMGGVNPLNQMSFDDAAQAVIKHVTDGVQLGKKHGLPEQIISFISTHHGRSKVKYFYNSFVNQNPDIKPDEELFTYPGPLPFSKETAILMMADAVEARSRTLPEYTEESISYMVNDMIDTQIADGQFKEAPISFKDVETVKHVLTEKIKNIYHSRIVYPKIEKPEEE